MPSAKQRAHVQAMKQAPIRKLREKPTNGPKESWWTKHAAPNAPRENFVQAVSRRHEERTMTAYVTPWNRKEKADA